MSDSCKGGIHHGKCFFPGRCSRRAVKDGYCKQHHPETARARHEVLISLVEAQLENDRLRAEVRQAEQLVLVEAEKLVTAWEAAGTRTDGPELFDAVEELRAARKAKEKQSER